jgi:hypothetical protein
MRKPQVDDYMIWRGYQARQLVVRVVDTSGNICRAKVISDNDDNGFKHGQIIFDGFTHDNWKLTNIDELVGLVPKWQGPEIEETEKKHGVVFVKLNSMRERK